MVIPEEKQKILDILIKWYGNKDKKRQYVTIGGYAGTGKTTLIGWLRKDLQKNFPKLKVSFCSYTGKATRVLRSVLSKEKILIKGDSVGTIHSLIYSPMVNDKEEIIGWEKQEKIKSELIIIDEASMVDESIWNDLLSYKIPIIAIGDHGQLPPINGNFNLMAKPDFVLTTIYRQKENNPIIDLSIMAREKGLIPVEKYSNKVMKLDRSDSETGEIVEELLSNFDEDTLVLCGYNATRVKLNKFIRSKLEIESSEPIIGDRVICLRNNHKKGIFNGMIGEISRIVENDENTYYVKIEFDEDNVSFEGLINKAQFNATEAMNFTQKRSLTLNSDLFDFGYAITVHKSQGSQAKSVVLFEERFSKMDDTMWKRWLYTGVTRAQERLIIVGR